MKALLLDGSESQEVDLDGIAVEDLSSEQLYWFLAHDEQELREIFAQLGLPVEGGRARQFEEHRSDVEVVLYVAPADEVGPSPQAVRCFVSERWVITALENGHEPTVFDEFSEYVVDSSAAAGAFDGMTFLAELFDWVINSYAELFARLETRLEDLDNSLLLVGGGGKEISELVSLKRYLSVLRRSLVQHRATLMVLQRPELQEISSEKSSRWMKESFERFDNVLEQGRDLRDSIRGSFDIISTKAADRTNDRMTVLTIVSVLLLPGTVIAGVMGMNFKVGLFRTTWLFWIVVAMILLIAAVVLIVLVRSGWIDLKNRGTGGDRTPDELEPQ